MRTEPTVPSGARKASTILSSTRSPLAGIVLVREAGSGLRPKNGLSVMEASVEVGLWSRSSDCQNV